MGFHAGAAVALGEPPILLPIEPRVRDFSPPVDAAPKRPLLLRPVYFFTRVLEGVFGIVTLIVGLAVLATYPLLQFLSLGYLLEVSGRVARTGRLRDGFIGIRQAARVGGLVIGLTILLLPLMFAGSMAQSARLIDPDSPAAKGWQLGLLIATAVLGLHAIGACLRGGRLRSFLIPRPIKLIKQLFSRGAYARMRDGLWNFTVSLRLPYYFWLGLRGFVGATMWLALPVSMLALASRLPTGLGVIVGLVGGALLAFVIMHLPLMQARFARVNRFRALFEIRESRRTFARAPIAYWIALVFTLALAVPLYFLKIEIIPREAAWLPSLLFVMSIFPARLLVGWACGRAYRRETSRHWIFRWTSRLAMLPVAAIYVLIIYFTQYLSWYGVWSLYEQHAFLVPVPFSY
jgi:hypothetical protein